MKINLTAVVAAALLMTSIANAHAHLELAIPADGATVAASPESIMLMFSEAAKLTALTIQKDGEEPQKLGPLPTKAAAHLMVTAPNLAPGHYTIDYRVLSDDNHVMAGRVQFTVAPPK